MGEEDLGSGRTVSDSNESSGGHLEDAGESGSEESGGDEYGLLRVLLRKDLIDMGVVEMELACGSHVKSEVLIGGLNEERGGRSVLGEEGLGEGEGGGVIGRVLGLVEGQFVEMQLDAVLQVEQEDMGVHRVVDPHFSFSSQLHHTLLSLPILPQRDAAQVRPDRSHHIVRH